MSAIISTLIQAELKGSLSCEKMTNRSVLDILSNGGYPDEGKRTTTSSSSTSTSLNKTESMRKFDVVDDENENKIIDSPHSIVSDIILTSTISTARNNRHNNNNNNNNNHHLKHHHHSSNNNNSVKHSLQNISSKRKSKRRGFTSLPAESETSYSSHIGYQLEYNNREQNENELTTRTTPTSTLVYSSSAPLSTTTRFDRNNDVVSTVNSNNNNNNTTNTVTINSNTTNGIQFSGSRGSSSLRKSSVIEPVPSTSSWHNSVEQETYYVVDPAQGNAYYKGQFLGKGGFARVYLMTDASTGSQYACKIIPKNRMQKIHMQKIAREVTIHKELNHVNVVQMHHYFEDNRNVYMLLEACPQKSLMHVLKYRGKVTEPEARYYMKQMVTGVAYIHSQRVVHRDLKPGNMFLSDRMIVKIGDFGLATRPDGQHRRVTICGTPNYIAPEVLHKQAYSYEADVWALGCILYALLVGQPPFDTASLKETYARIRNNRYREVDDTIASPSGQDLIRWLLQPNPELRPSLERVKEHAYLTKEYVPASLPRTCCYQMPHSSIIEPPPITSSTSKTSDCSKLQTSHNLMQPDISRYQTMSSQQLPLQSGKVKRKQGNVKNWLARKIPKLPRFRQRLRSVLCPDHKKFSALPQSVQMHRALESCIASIKSIRVLYNPPTVDDAVPLFVTKWIDYSNKYGLGFQLSDKSVGVLFNDSTKMSYTHDRRRVEYVTTDDEITRYHRERDIPVNLQKKLDLIRHFTEYMDGYLTEGGEVKELRCTTKRSKKSYVPRMRRWLRTNKAIVMELTVPLLQVNFFVDHTKMIVSLETAAKGYLVTYIDAARHVSSYWLNDIRDFGCTSDLRERLHYVCKVSREFAKLDNDTVA